MIDTATFTPGMIQDEKYTVVFGPGDRVRLSYDPSRGVGHIRYKGQSAEFDHVAGSDLGPKRAKVLAASFRAKCGREA